MRLYKIPPLHFQRVSETRIASVFASETPVGRYELINAVTHCEWRLLVNGAVSVRVVRQCNLPAMRDEANAHWESEAAKFLEPASLSELIDTADEISRNRQAEPV